MATAGAGIRIRALRISRFSRKRQFTNYRNHSGREKRARLWHGLSTLGPVLQKLLRPLLME